MSVRVLEVLGHSAGGIARHVHQVVEGLGARPSLELEIAGPSLVAARFDRPILDLDIPDGITGHRRAMRSLKAILGSGDFSVVHAHGLRAGLDTVLAAEGTTPVLVTLHNLVTPDASWLKRWLFRRAERTIACRAHLTFVVSKDMEEHLKRVAPNCATRLETLHAAIGDPPRVGRDRSAVRAELEVPQGAALVVTVTRLAPQKDLTTMLEALSRLEREAVLAVVGEGPLETELRSAADGLGISERVRFTGFRIDAPDIIAAADAFCMSSTWEAVALAAQEAVLLGVPVVATAVGGLVELIEDGVSGRLVPPRDPDALAAALEDVLADPQRGLEFAAEAKRRSERTFSKDAMLDRLERAYLEAARA